MTTLSNQGQPRAERPAATPTPVTPGPVSPGLDDGRRDDVLPVILGGDIGAYSLARSFHEAYGVRSVVVSQFPTGVVRRSRIVENVVEPRIDDAVCLVARLREIAGSTSATCLLLGSADWHVRRIVEHRAHLDDRFVIPYPRREVLDQATDKERFSRLCAELGIGHPTTAVYDLSAGGPSWGGPPTDTLDYPVVAKAASTAEYHQVDFPGKKKVYHLGTASELDDLMAQLTRAGYSGRFLVQREIGGNDAQMRILTCYSDRYGRVRLASFGHVLLEEHTPGALGNPAGIITTRDDAVVAQAVRLLEHIGWTGFSNFDIKVDPVDGTCHFFELNPRLGRSNYYVTASGHNPATYYVTEHVDGRDVGTLAPPEGSTQHPADGSTRHPTDGPTEHPTGSATNVTVATGSHLYTVLPHRLLLSYLDGPLRARAAALIASGAVTNPLWYRPERDPRRLAYLAVAQANQFRKYRQHHPRRGPA
ncbi:MAG: carboxylate--amine ligase [Micrococcales bacterium]|nr:carboxylate--amine ligase [Micrococcales bacterium]